MNAIPMSWEATVRAAGPCDHLIQLYTDDDFLARAVVTFAETGFAKGEAMVVIATPAHVDAVVAALGEAGRDVAALRRGQQLQVLDARLCLDSFLVDGQPDRDAFAALVSGIVRRPRTAGWARVRLFGEMVDLLWDQSLPATLALEELWNEVLREHGLSLLCAYRLDNFDREAHRGVLHQVTRCHSHLIPVEDYERLAQAVDRAYAEVFGPGGDTEALREILVERQPGAPAMPAAQAALVALRDLAPRVADAVLERTRAHYRRRSHAAA